MQDEAQLASLTLTVLFAGLGIGAVFGAVAHAARFCTMGALLDLFSVGSAERLRMWGLAVGVAILGTQGLITAGLTPAGITAFEAARLPWLSLALGGGLFGLGMVLASGCGLRTVVRMGEGSLKALVVFIVLALTSLITIRGITAVWRAQTVDRVAQDLGAGQSLPDLLSAAAPGQADVETRLATLLAIGLGLLILTIVLRPGLPRRYLIGGTLVGLCATAAWAATANLGYLLESPLTLEPAFMGSRANVPEALTFVGPPAFALEYLLYFSDRSQTMFFGATTLLGVVIGAFFAARARGRFHIEGFRTTSDLAHHLIGGALMGVGGVMAGGCTIGHGLSGLAMLSVGSVIAVAAMAWGAFVGHKYLEWRG